jgi:hypothetical protein
VLVFIDTLFRMTLVKDANDYAQVTAALDPLLAVARDQGAHVMVLHHSPKGDPRQAIDAALGSTAIAGTVDTLIVMRRNDRFRSLVTEQREGAGFSDEVTLDFDPVTRRVSLGPTRKDADEQQAAAAILEWLQTQPEPVDESTINQAVDGQRTTAKRYGLRKLVEEGKVARIGDGKKDKPYVYAAVSKPSEDSRCLVSTISREQENKNFESGENPDRAAENSRSQGLAISGENGNKNPSNREQESGDLFAKIERVMPGSRLRYVGEPGGFDEGSRCLTSAQCRRSTSWPLTRRWWLSFRLKPQPRSTRRCGIPRRHSWPACSSSDQRRPPATEPIASSTPQRSA